jgi:molybdopterin molybdotransferase
MRPFASLVSKEDALARILEAAQPLGRAEEVPLAAARGRACAEDVRAPHDVPPYARATMDGYAVRAADGDVPRVLVGEVFAGATKLPEVGRGEAVRIATGAPLPPGADAVVRVEDTREEGGEVFCKTRPAAAGHVDAAGADIKAGALAVARGALLTPARLGVLASVGRATVRVAARPRVAVVVTGDELLGLGAPHDPLRIYDSNGSALRGLFENAGAVVTTHRAHDEIEALRMTLRAIWSWTRSTTCCSTVSA